MMLEEGWHGRHTGTDDSGVHLAAAAGGQLDVKIERVGIADVGMEDSAAFHIRSLLRLVRETRINRARLAATALFCV